MSKPASNRMLVIGCGATAWDAAGRLQGCADLPLSPQGKACVLRAIAEVGTQINELRTILVGPDDASRETAELIADAAAHGQIARPKIFTSDELTDLSLGLWEGSTAQELLVRCPRSAGSWLEDAASATAPEGEAWEAFTDRVLAGLAGGLAKAKPGTAVCVVLRPIAFGLVRSRFQAKPLPAGGDLVCCRSETFWTESFKGDPRLGPRTVSDRQTVRAA